MQINEEVKEILREYKINIPQGLICLLGIYHNLDISWMPEEVVKAINLTKIVEKDYKNSLITWNIPLFEEQQTAFEWVKDWAEPWKKLNPERYDTLKDVIKRMQEFFQKNPVFRKDDVYKARDIYLRTVTNGQYLKSSAKFIYEGKGGEKKSMLLGYCERVKEQTSPGNSNMKGRIAT